MILPKKTYFAHFIGIFVTVLTCLTMPSCSDEMDLPGEDEKARTVIIYMSAENSLLEYAKQDLQEMYAAVDSIPDSCQVVVYYDGELAPAIYKLTNGSHVTWREYDEDLDSADSTVMASTLKDIVKNFPSNHYSLVLWGHGTGWQHEEEWVANAREKAILIDNDKNATDGASINRGTWLQVPELKGVLSVMPKLDYLMLDLCYGQNIETDYEVRDRADYIIGSPSEIPAEGAPYGKIMRALCVSDIEGIINGYSTFYGTSRGDPLSVVKCSELENLAAMTASVVTQVFQRTDMPTTDSVQQYAPDWGNMYSQQVNLPVPYDMRSAIYHALATKGLEAEYEAWDKQWQKTVLYATAPGFFDSKYSSARYGSYFRTITDSEHFGGVSMNIPREDYETSGHNAFYHALDWYKAAGWSGTGW